MNTLPSADRIEQVAFGFMASKVLFGAIEFGVFTELAKQPLEGQILTQRLGLHPRSARQTATTRRPRFAGELPSGTVQARPCSLAGLTTCGQPFLTPT